VPVVEPYERGVPALPTYLTPTSSNRFTRGAREVLSRVMPTRNALVDELESITTKFVHAIVSAMRKASLADILGAEEQAPARRGPGRPKGSVLKLAGPQSPAAAAGAGSSAAPRPELILAYMKSHPGTSGEAARAALGIPRGQWGTYVARALKGGKLRKEGQKRATRYWAT